MREVFIVVPSLNPTGPIKGAVALANGLADTCPVTLAALKAGPEPVYRIAEGVRVVRLAEYGSPKKRLDAYTKLLAEAGGRSHSVSVSMCLSADFFNAMCKKHARIISSVRGNLPQNYRMDYGPLGVGAAMAHLVLLRRFDAVTAMSESMADQIRRFLGRRPEVVHNFIDEAELEPYRATGRHTGSGEHRFVFVGSLSLRKKPKLLLEGAKELKARGEQVHIRLVGDGPMRTELERDAKSMGLGDCVAFMGQRDDPYPEVAAADVFVLPSLSEGVSRAALEALYLGVPCVMRDVDANRELVKEPAQGRLFSRDEDIAHVMLAVSQEAKQRTGRACLLPPEFRQEYAIARYRGIIGLA